MWIRIRSNEGPNISFPVPLSVAGSRLLLRLAAKHAGPEATAYVPYAADMVRELRAYVRSNGHFVLVDVKDNSGDTVRITV